MFVVYLFVFVVYRTDPSRPPSRQSAGGLATHPTHTRTRTRARTHAHAPTRNKTRNETPHPRARTHAHTYARTHTRTYAPTHPHTHTWAHVYLSNISFALCSLCKCYLGEYAPRKIPLDAYQERNSLQNCPFLWPEYGHSFILFLSTTAHKPYLSPYQTPKNVLFLKFFFALYPLQTLHFQKKIKKRCIFFVKMFGSVVFY